MKTIAVTQLEKEVLEALAGEMYAECGFSDAGLGEVVESSGLPVNVVRGVMSSLIKKDLLYVWNRENDWGVNARDPYMHIWYLTDKTKGLVSEWVREGEVEAVELIVQ